MCVGKTKIYFLPVYLLIGALCGTPASASQRVPIEIVDFQQYNAFQAYLKVKAKHKVMVVSEHMQPGAAYGWADTRAQAEKNAMDHCKDKYRYDCMVVSVNGKSLGKTRRLPDVITPPAGSAQLNIDAQSDATKALFKGYPFTNMYTTAKFHKAYAVNNFGRSGSGHGRGYLTEEIAVERALFHCNLDVSFTKDLSKRLPCHVVAIGDRLLPENIEKVLAQTQLGITPTQPGEMSESWHGNYALDLADMAARLGVAEGEKILFVFGADGFQLRKGSEIMSSGTYIKENNRILLTYVSGESDGRKKTLLLAKDFKSIKFEHDAFSSMNFIKAP